MFSVKFIRDNHVPGECCSVFLILNRQGIEEPQCVPYFIFVAFLIETSLVTGLPFLSGPIVLRQAFHIVLRLATSAELAVPENQIAAP